MIIGVRWYAFLSICWSASNQSSLTARIDVEVLPIYIHYTADLLSQKLPICLNFIISTPYSSTSHPITNPTSLILFIVNLTFGFVWYSNSFWIFCGHTYGHTQSCMLLNPGAITLPAPNWHMSMYCKQSGYFMTTICTGVGFSARWCTNICQYFSADTMYRVIVTYSYVVLIDW